MEIIDEREIVDAQKSRLLITILFAHFYVEPIGTFLNLYGRYALRYETSLSIFSL